MSKYTKQDGFIRKVVVDAIEQLAEGCTVEMIADKIETMNAEDLLKIQRRAILAVAEKELKQVCGKTQKVSFRGRQEELAFAAEIEGRTIGFYHWTRHSIKTIRDNSRKNREAVDKADDEKQELLGEIDKVMAATGAQFLGEVVVVEEEKKAA